MAGQTQMEQELQEGVVEALVFKGQHQGLLVRQEILRQLLHLKVITVVLVLLMEQLTEQVVVAVEPVL